MVARKWYAIAILSAAIFAGCAVSPEVEERRQTVEANIETILSKPIDTDQPREIQRCLADRDYRNFRVLDDRRILFEGRRGDLWLNTLRTRCPDLRHSTVLQVRSFSSIGRICDADSFMAGDWFDWPWYRRWPWQWGSGWGTGMACTLGKFQPVTESQVEAIEAAIKAK